MWWATAGRGVLDHDLRAACLQALEIPREAAVAHARKFTWEASARQFLDNVLLARNLPDKRNSAKQKHFLVDRQSVER